MVKINFTNEQYVLFRHLVCGTKKWITVEVPEGKSAALVGRLLRKVHLCCPDMAVESPVIKQVTCWTNPHHPRTPSITLFLGDPER